MSPPAVLVSNGAISPHSPPSVAAFLESTPGAYTTARASSAGLLLWWPRHLLRLADSARILANSHPHLLGLSVPPPRTLSAASIEPLVNQSVRVGVREMRRRMLAPGECCSGEDMALTALVRVGEATEALEVRVHLGVYVPPVFGEAGARLAVAGSGREAAAAKYAPWARMRKNMEKMRPPGATELLLTNDGDHILEGSVTNFFVVCLKVRGLHFNGNGTDSDFLQCVQVYSGLMLIMCSRKQINKLLTEIGSRFHLYSCNAHSQNFLAAILIEQGSYLCSTPFCGGFHVIIL